ncbi:MAG: hypothetical protein AB7W47_03190 [Calditrichaceae bacterium]
MKNKSALGAVLAIVGFFAGMLLFYHLADTYMTVINGKIAGGRPDEAIAVMITQSMLGWLGISASALWVVVMYGYLKKLEWAGFWAIVAASLQMLAGFFPTIPAKSIDLPAPTMTVFIIATVVWFGIMFIEKVDKKVIALLFVAGLAYVLTYMCGVALISKYQTTTYNDLWKGMYAVDMMVTWFGATAWLVFSLAVLKRKSWSLYLGIFASMMSLIGALPLAIVNIMEVHRFSMFLPAPIIAGCLLIVLLMPNTNKLLTEWKNS